MMPAHQLEGGNGHMTDDKPAVTEEVTLHAAEAGDLVSLQQDLALVRDAAKRVSEMDESSLDPCRLARLFGDQRSSHTGAPSTRKGFGTLA